jgi:hypothetical protein
VKVERKMMVVHNKLRSIVILKNLSALPMDKFLSIYLNRHLTIRCNLSYYPTRLVVTLITINAQKFTFDKTLFLAEKSLSQLKAYRCQFTEWVGKLVNE